MEFRIADTFTDSLAKLTGQEQKAVKTTAFDLQMDSVNPGMSFHKLDRAKDPNFWSVRVNADIRLIVHKTASSLLLVYAGHHDKAYKWAECRKIERHPKTGAAQLVEIRETVEEIVIHQTRVEKQPALAKPCIFANLSKGDLLGFGVPSEWVNEVRKATEDSLFDIAEHLPQEATEALLELAVGVQPKVAPVTAESDNPFDHPDAQRRFRVMANQEELAIALNDPWEKWTVFLHPSQRQCVEKDYTGPSRISGSAGTGKTIVALHRAAHLARKHPNAKILLTTFSSTLASTLQTKLNRLVGNESDMARRIKVRSIKRIGEDLYAQSHATPNIADDATIRNLLSQHAASLGTHHFSDPFLLGEWKDVVDAWQLKSWEDYRDVQRLGRKTRIGGKQREMLWAIFATVRAELDDRNLMTWADLFGRVTQEILDQAMTPFDFAVVDEAQDLGVAEVRFLAALGSGRSNALFFAGDLGQRIFQQPFSWKSLGVDIRGRSGTLRINYRTSHQIRSHADRLLPSAISDVDGNDENRKETISVFDGPPPQVKIVDSIEEESAVVAGWLMQQLDDDLQPHEIGVFIRSPAQLDRARNAVKMAGATALELDNGAETEAGKISVCTMHLAKGLEFRAVAVIACDDEVLPLQERIEAISDDADLEEVYNTERHLLYVACTRARDHLLVTGVDPASEFLDDFGLER
ncbi:MAG: UvrD-helicase domain-containing protein [Nitrospirae bacterium]|nr:UvrD-helicase domain-containing protein [Magnetococcales bacterium]HAT48958.1 DNA helicase [Alphaproteobacteria bacterium]